MFVWAECKTVGLGAFARIVSRGFIVAVIVLPGLGACPLAHLRIEFGEQGVQLRALRDKSVEFSHQSSRIPISEFANPVVRNPIGNYLVLGQVGRDVDRNLFEFQ